MLFATKIQSSLRTVPPPSAQQNIEIKIYPLPQKHKSYFVIMYDPLH
jgi:hypothetical protein